MERKWNAQLINNILTLECKTHCIEIDDRFQITGYKKNLTGDDKTQIFNGKSVELTDNRIITFKFTASKKVNDDLSERTTDFVKRKVTCQGLDESQSRAIRSFFLYMERKFETDQKYLSKYKRLIFDAIRTYVGPNRQSTVPREAILRYVKNKIGWDNFEGKYFIEALNDIVEHFEGGPDGLRISWENTRGQNSARTGKAATGVEEHGDGDGDGGGNFGFMLRLRLQ